MNKKEIWLNIANYHFNHLAPANLWDVITGLFEGHSAFTKAFADKLSRKLKWDKKFAMKAIWEYKKFVYLGVISDSSVTPSKIIDQVWHEHLLFSSGYRKFCKEVIHYDFDHNPELISIGKQTQLFRSQYFYTIELYEKEFGSKPPTDIWKITKFNLNKDQSNKSKNIKSSDSLSSGSNGEFVSLISMFPSADSIDFEFGGGESAGGGAGAGWDDGSGDTSTGDSGGGSDSGSSCSSSCSSCGGGD